MTFPKKNPQLVGSSPEEGASLAEAFAEIILVSP